MTKVINKGNGKFYYVYFKEKEGRIWQLYWSAPVFDLESAQKYCAGARMLGAKKTKILCLTEMIIKPPSQVKRLSDIKGSWISS